MKRRPEAEAGEIVVMGHSYGGITSLVAAAHVSGIKAAVDSAGATLTWKGNKPLQDYLAEEVQKIKVPTLLMQDNQGVLQPDGGARRALASKA